MRFKVNIEYIQSTDPDDWTEIPKKKKADGIKKRIKSLILGAIQDAVDGHGYPLVDLQESLKYAMMDDTVEVNVEYLDDNF